MAFGQVFKKRNGGPGSNNDGESTFSFGEGEVEIPDIGDTMDQLERHVSEAKSIKVVEKEETMSRGCGC